MPDISDIEQKINVLKFQLSVLGPGNPQADDVKQQIADLQRELAFAKVRQGSNS